MYPDIFNRCMRVVFRHEGGYVNDPNDLGGETKYGIAKRFFPNEDIKSLTKERSKSLYYHEYWLPMKLAGICNERVILEVFDMGINAGKRRAIRMIQKLIGAKEDGIIGQETIGKINNYNGFLLKDFKHARKIYYEFIADRRPQNKKFLNGWLNRVDNTEFLT